MYKKILIFFFLILFLNTFCIKLQQNDKLNKNIKEWVDKYNKLKLKRKKNSKKYNFAVLTLTPIITLTLYNIKAIKESIKRALLSLLDINVNNNDLVEIQKKLENQLEIDQSKISSLQGHLNQNTNLNKKLLEKIELLESEKETSNKQNQAKFNSLQEQLNQHTNFNTTLGNEINNFKLSNLKSTSIESTHYLYEQQKPTINKISYFTPKYIIITIFVFSGLAGLLYFLRNPFKEMLSKFKTMVKSGINLLTGGYATSTELREAMQQINQLSAKINDIQDQWNYTFQDLKNQMQEYNNNHNILKEKVIMNNNLITSIETYQKTMSENLDSFKKQIDTINQKVTILQNKQGEDKEEYIRINGSINALNNNLNNLAKKFDQDNISIENIITQNKEEIRKLVDNQAKINDHSINLARIACDIKNHHDKLLPFAMAIGICFSQGIIQYQQDQFNNQYDNLMKEFTAMKKVNNQYLRHIATLPNSDFFDAQMD